MNIKSLLVVAALGAGLCAAGPAVPSPDSAARRPAPEEWEALSTRFGGSKADTKPSKDSLMAFTVSSQVRDVLVEGGQAVKKDDLLVRARDEDQVAIVEGQKIQAASENEIQAAQLAMELAKLKYDRLLEAGTYSPSEKDELRVQFETSKVQLAQANVRHDLETMRLQQAEGQLARYRLYAPFDGIVEEVKVELGQGVRESDGAIRVVNIDTLRLDPYAPTNETIELKVDKGHKAWVLVDVGGRPRLVEGTVINISPVADSVSQRRRVRVEFDNAEKWPAGTQAMVRFTEPGAEWNEYRAAKQQNNKAASEGTEPGNDRGRASAEAGRGG